MKVLVTSEIFPPDFGGGSEYIVLELVRGLIRRGIEVSVVATGDPSASHYDGIRTFRLPVSTYRFNLQADAITEIARGHPRARLSDWRWLILQSSLFIYTGHPADICDRQRSLNNMAWR
jgi:hypothetical protein